MTPWLSREWTLRPQKFKNQCEKNIPKEEDLLILTLRKNVLLMRLESFNCDLQFLIWFWLICYFYTNGYVVTHE